jgi:hypothetical protein
LRELFGGVPFLDATFKPTTLLTVVAVVRRERLGAATAPLNSMLTPDRGVEAGGGKTAEQFGLDVRSLTQKEADAVAGAKESLAAAAPHWGALVALPVRFQGMTRHGAISASVDSLPQHVFLSAEAFDSPSQLREQVLHELSHNWLYLIAELYRLYDRKSKVRSTLPSGTPDRSPAEVIGAAHVVANILILHATSPYLTPEREDLVRDYLDGCLRIIEGFKDVLTPTGLEIAERIRVS